MSDNSSNKNDKNNKGNKDQSSLKQKFNWRGNYQEKDNGVRKHTNMVRNGSRVMDYIPSFLLVPLTPVMPYISMVDDFGAAGCTAAAGLVDAGASFVKGTDVQNKGVKDANYIKGLKDAGEELTAAVAETAITLIPFVEYANMGGKGLNLRGHGRYTASHLYRSLIGGELALYEKGPEGPKS